MDGGRGRSDNTSGRPRPRWWEEGEEPDYRATLANDRTFLAWMRTSLALLGGALAVLELSSIDPRPLRLALACCLVAVAVATTATGYVQWRSVQRRMRRREPLGRSAHQPVITACLLVFTGLVVAAVILAGR